MILSERRRSDADICKIYHYDDHYAAPYPLKCTRFSARARTENEREHSEGKRGDGEREYPRTERERIPEGKKRRRYHDKDSAVYTRARRTRCDKRCRIHRAHRKIEKPQCEKRKRQRRMMRNVPQYRYISAHDHAPQTDRRKYQSRHRKCATADDSFKFPSKRSTQAKLTVLKESFSRKGSENLMLRSDDLCLSRANRQHDCAQVRRAHVYTLRDGVCPPREAVL